MEFAAFQRVTAKTVDERLADFAETGMRRFGGDRFED
jgi:hypothetical protein